MQRIFSASATAPTPPTMIKIVTEMLVITDAPKVASKLGFCAGIILWDDKVAGAADIVRYMHGWPRDKVCHYCAERGWTVTAVAPTAANDALMHISC